MDTPCSAASAAADEPLIGSAPRAVAWVCLEQNGPWGARAWTSSHLDPELGSALETAAAAHQVRPSLIRGPGRHADARYRHAQHAAPRMVLVAHSTPGAAWLLAGQVTEPEQLAGLDWAAVAAGDRTAAAASLPGLCPAPPQLLVCTNGTRDTCCARLGRPVAASAATRFPGQVWEVTHTSGHRLAPTTVLLPSGSLHGRVLDASPLLAAEAEGRVELLGYRGRSVWDAPGQVAEEAVRRTFGILGLDDLQVVSADPHVLVSHRDGRTWTVALTAYDEGERPESCGKPSKPITRYHAQVLEA